MRPDALAEAIATDRAKGVTPALVVAALNTMGVGAIDPLRAIGGICQREGVFYMWTRPGGQRTYSQRLQMDD